MALSTQKMVIFSIYFSSVLSSSSTSSVPCSSVYRFRFNDYSLTVPNHHFLFLSLMLSWTRTVFSTVGCVNLFLCLLCIHPVLLHICSHTETLVITEHNFLVNHVKLSNKGYKTLPIESVMSSMYVFTQFC